MCRDSESVNIHIRSGGPNQVEQINLGIEVGTLEVRGENGIPLALALWGSGTVGLQSLEGGRIPWMRRLEAEDWP